jgi:hypothetical protein
MQFSQPNMSTCVPKVILLLLSVTADPNQMRLSAMISGTVMALLTLLAIFAMGHCCEGAALSTRKAALELQSDGHMNISTALGQDMRANSSAIGAGVMSDALHDKAHT